MSNLYEIDKAMLECVDLETGEIIDEDKLNALAIERDDKIEGIALWIKNLLSDAEAYKTEKKAFEEKEKAAKNKAESLKQYLEAALAGDTFKTTKVNVTYRKSSAIELDDNFIGWAKANADDLLKYPEPAPDKTAIKQAIKDGVVVEHAQLVEKQNIQIK